MAEIKLLNINGRLIGKNKPCYIIAEIGSNFDGDINKAKKLIKKAKEAGADAAKFQSFETNKILSRKGFGHELLIFWFCKPSFRESLKSVFRPKMDVSPSHDDESFFDRMFFSS